MSTDSRHYPERPLLAVSVVLWRDGKVLLARRARPPAQAIWSFPGGLVEIGETLEMAAAREIREETGLEVDILGQIDRAEVVRRDEDGRVERHYVILVFAGRYLSGMERAGDDADAVGWYTPNEAERLEMTPDTARIVRRGEA